jgi:hypothetical protein
MMRFSQGEPRTRRPLLYWLVLIADLERQLSGINVNIDLQFTPAALLLFRLVLRHQ